jgi:cobalamin biosynthetic protein CobC
MKAPGRADPLSTHGGQRSAAQARFPGAPQPWLDLSTGINPVAYPVPALSPKVFTDLPDPAALAALEATAAEAYGVADPSLVAAAPGTQILIDLLPRLLPPTDVAVLGPTYGEHGPGWLRAGHRLRSARHLHELRQAKVAVVVNPNNPDGRVLAAADLLALGVALDARGGLLVVDEAFADLEEGTFSLSSRLPRPGIVVLRSFGKTYGLAGLRLGFALATADIAAEIRAALGPWAVSGPAIAVGTAALADRPWREASAARCSADALHLDRLMTGGGFDALGGTRLFRLYRHDRAPDWFERLGQAGILVRPFDYQPDWLRLGLPGDEAALARLEEALR